MARSVERTGAQKQEGALGDLRLEFFEMRQ
jgi:hypothetical protein